MEKSVKPAKNLSVKDEILMLNKRVKELERQNQELIETNLYGIMEIDIYGNINYINKVMCKLLGYNVADCRIKEIWSLIPDDELRKSLTEHLTSLIRDKNQSGKWSGTFVTEDDEDITLRALWTSRRDANNQVAGFVAIITHIEDQEPFYKPIEEKPHYDMDQTQAWMAGKEVNYQRIIENTHELIIIFDTKGKIKFVNESGINLIGYFEEELVEMNITDFIPADQIKSMRDLMLRNYKEKKRDLLLFNTEIINRNLDLVPMEVSISLMERYGRLEDVLIVGRELSRRP